MNALKIVAIAFVAFLVGAATLSAVLTGKVMMSILAAPLFAIFGWFFFPGAVLFVAIVWSLYSMGRRTLIKQVAFLVLPGIVIALAMALIGPKEIGSEVKWTLGYALGGLLAGFVMGLLVIVAKGVSTSESTLE